MNEKKNTISNSFTSNGRSPRRIVAVDPGIVGLGLATFTDDKLTDYAVRIIPPAPSIRDRLSNLEEVVDHYLEEKKPAAIALEKTTFSSATQNGLLVLAYYKILAVARRRHIPVYEYVPISIRKSVCGNGHATKHDVEKILVSRFPELRAFTGTDRRWKERRRSHMFDAVAVGLTHLIRTRPNENSL